MVSIFICHAYSRYQMQELLLLLLHGYSITSALMIVANKVEQTVDKHVTEILAMATDIARVKIHFAEKPTSNIRAWNTTGMLKGEHVLIEGP